MNRAADDDVVEPVADVEADLEGPTAILHGNAVSGLPEIGVLGQDP